MSILSPLAGPMTPRRSNDTFRVFSTTATVVMLGIYLWGRGISHDPYHAIVIAGWSLFLQWNPLLEMAWKRLGSPVSEAWASGPGAGAVSGFALLVLIGVIPLPLVELLPAITGFWLAGVGVRRWLATVKTGRMITLLSGGMIGHFLATFAWGAGYQHVDNLDALSRQICLSDPLFHAAIAQMFDTHGVATTGIHGVERIPYHIGSHWIIAQWSSTLRIGPYQVYPAVTGLLFIPMHLFGILIMAEAARFKPSDDQHGLTLHSLLPAFAGFIGILPLPIIEELRLGYSFWLSESGCMAIAIWLLTIGMSIDWFRHQSADRPAIGLGYACVFPVLISTLAITKISVGAIGLGMAGYGLLRIGLWRRPLAVLSLGVATFAYFRIHQWTYLPAYGELTKSIIPFAFWREYIPIHWWPYAMVLHLLWTLLTGWWLIRRANIITLGELWSGFRERKTIALELLIVATVLGLLPGLVWRLFAGAAAYFQDCQRWMSIGLLMGLWWQPSKVMTRTISTWRQRLSNYQIQRLLVSMIYTLVFGMIGMNFLFAVRRLNNDVCVTHGWPMHADLSASNWEGLRKGLSTLFTGKRISGTFALPRNRTAQPASQQALVDQLVELSRRPLEEKRRSFLFIPRSNRAYWDFLEKPDSPTPPDARRRMSVSFMAPAITGFAMIDGVPEYHKDIKYIGYGLELVPAATPFDHFTTASERETEVKRMAEQWGIRRILVFDHSPETGFTLTTWEW